MSMGKRAYNLLRAYVGREWERIESVFESDARSELNEFLESKPSTTPQPPTTTEQKPEAEPTQSAEPGKMTEQTAYRVLNLSPSATLADLQREYKRLSERSLPTNFPEGSDERKKAAEVHLRVQEAYDTLLPKMDVRLKRFQNLDLG